MYKKYKVNIMEAGKEYFRMLRKMFPVEEDDSTKIEQLAYNNVVKDEIISGSKSEKEFEDSVQKEINNILKLKESMRTIRTARTETEINEAVKQGYKPLIKEVVPSDKIRVMYSLERDIETGEVSILHDSWEIYTYREGTERVIDNVYYYPYQFPSPFAAYLVPPDIVVGERVILEDLIEDIVGARHKMHTYRLASAEAMWNGEEFEIDHDSYSVDMTIG